MSVSQTAPSAYRAGTSDAEIEAAAAIAIKQRKTLVLVLRLLILVVILGGWEFFSRTGEILDHIYGIAEDAPRQSFWEFSGRDPAGLHKSMIDAFFFSSPSRVAQKLYEWVTEGTSLGSLWYQIWVTFEEATLGFLLGAVAGILAGIALGRNRLAADVFSIYIKIANAIPRVVLAPIFIIAFGFGITSKIAVAFVMVFFVVFANAFQGVREADRAMIANAQILGASPSQVTRAVIIPSAMSWIFASLHVSFGFAIVGAVVGELLGSRAGIGQLIAVAQGSFDPAGVFGGMIVLLIVAITADYAMSALERRLVKWRPAPFNEGQG